MVDINAISLRILITIIVYMMVTLSLAQNGPLPKRTSPIPQTTNSVPHILIGVCPDQYITVELLHRVEKIPGVEIRDTVISLPGAKGFWLIDELALARPDAIVGGREFAHLHPDGSLHAALHPQLAREAVEKGWAIPHPWADQR